jgi:hypothetical protein
MAKKSKKHAKAQKRRALKRQARREASESASDRLLKRIRHERYLRHQRTVVTGK